MYHPDTDMLFPSRAIPVLKDLRDEPWRNLVEEVVGQEQTSLDHLGFVLMMIRLGGCGTCYADSYRAMRGCTACAIQTVRRYRGKDSELVKKYEKARQEMETYLAQREEKIAQNTS